MSQLCYRGKAVTKRAKNGQGRRGDPTHWSWFGMILRCTQKSHVRYARYGGRGIAVCERWMDYENFLADMGVRPPGLTLERIDTDGNYEPSNCRWATYSEQAQNRSTTRRLLVDGVLMPRSEVAKKYGINLSTLCRRVDMGWPSARWGEPPRGRK